LTAVVDNNRKCNQLVNEQAEISILLALPGVLSTLALAPWVIFLAGIYSMRTLIRLVGMEKISQSLQKFGLSSVSASWDNKKREKPTTKFRYKLLGFSSNTVDLHTGKVRLTR
jgi:hypothetical protein